MFLAPPEVHYDILRYTGKSTGAVLSSYDVVSWAIEQTCSAMEVSESLKLTQGLDFLRRRKICQRFTRAFHFISNGADRTKVIDTFWDDLQENESQTLVEMYGVQSDSERRSNLTERIDRRSEDPMMQQLIQDLDAIGSLAVADCAVDEEQEREISHEVERERQVQRPPRLTPRQETISKGLEEFIRRGKVSASTKNMISYAFELYCDTSAATASGAKTIDPSWFKVMMTDDYRHSVQLPTAQSRSDQYLRPVNWIVCGVDSEDMVVISPFEANTLMMPIKASTKVSLHTFAPRVTRPMISFDRLDFYTMTGALQPRQMSDAMIRNLNLFAGALYLSSTKAVNGLHEFLGILNQPSSLLQIDPEIDGFLSEDSRRALGWPAFSPFERSPLPFLKAVLTLRTHGQDFGHTHMGYLVSGRVIREEIMAPDAAG